MTSLEMKRALKVRSTIRKWQGLIQERIDTDTWYISDLEDRVLILTETFDDDEMTADALCISVEEVKRHRAKALIELLKLYERVLIMYEACCDDLLIPIYESDKHKLQLAKHFLSNGDKTTSKNLDAWVFSGNLGRLIRGYVDLIIDRYIAVLYADGDTSFHSVKVASKKSGLSPARIHQLVDEGKVSSISPNDHDIFINVHELEAYLTTRQRGGSRIKVLDQIIEDGIVYHSIKAASQIEGVVLSESRISQLLRENKIKGFKSSKQGKRLYVLVESIFSYQSNMIDQPNPLESLETAHDSHIEQLPVSMSKNSKNQRNRSSYAPVMKRYEQI